MPNPAAEVMRLDTDPLLAKIPFSAASNIAIDTANEKITYGELAHEIQRRVHRYGLLGLKPGDLVAIAARRDKSYVIDLLSLFALKAIVAPIDVLLTEERQKSLIERLSPHWRLQDSNLEPFARDTELKKSVFPKNDPCYVFFTSGSSGVPKPILGSRESFHAFVEWQHKNFYVNADDRIPFLTSTGFDVSLRDIFLPLYSGGTLLIPNSHDLATPQNILAWLENNKATRLHIVPSIARSWTSLNDQEWKIPLETVFFAGEVLRTSLLLSWRQKFPLTRHAVNLYGPTETTLACFSNTIELSTQVDSLQKDVAVGWPRPGYRFALLQSEESFERDQIHRALSEQRKTGEVIIITKYCSLGYLNTPEETNSRFIQLSTNEVSYRTGDIGSLQNDGLSIIGRIDDEIKINGIRIHPNEVATCMRGHRSIESCEVISDKSRPDHPRMIAFWVPKQHDKRLDSEQIRSFLSEKLPSAMIPSLFYQLDAMPLNSNGKIDRAKLLAILSPKADSGNRFDEQTTNHVQKWLLETCQRILGHEKIGLDEHFFELGGTSLQAAILIGEIAKEFRCSIGFSDIFSTPTFQAIASLIETSEKIKQVTIPAAPIQNDYPLAPQQRRWWNVYMPERNRSWATMVMTRDFEFDGGEKKFLEAIKSLIQEESALKIFFTRNKENEIRQSLIEDISELKLNYQDIHHFEQDQKVNFLKQLTIDIANREIDPFTWPLFRIHLIRLSATGYKLVFSIHHLISDGYSQNLLGQRLAEKLTFSETANSPHRPFSYIDFAVWASHEENNHAGQVIKAKKYWSSVFSKPYKQFRFQERWKGQDFDRGKAYCIEVPSELIKSIERIQKKNGTTIFNAFFSAKLLTLHRITKLDDLLVGTPALGRNIPGTEDIIGNFISLVTIRSSLIKTKTNSEFLKDIMQQTAMAMENQDFQYDRLLNLLQVPFNQDRFPLATIFISFINFQGKKNIQSPSVKTAELGFRDLGYAVKFDLMSYLREYKDGLSLQVQFRNNLFDPKDIEKFVALWLEQLHEITNSPAKKISFTPFDSNIVTEYVGVTSPLAS